MISSSIRGSNSSNAVGGISTPFSLQAAHESWMVTLMVTPLASVTKGNLQKHEINQLKQKNTGGKRTCEADDLPAARSVGEVPGRDSHEEIGVLDRDAARAEGPVGDIGSTCNNQMSEPRWTE